MLKICCTVGLILSVMFCFGQQIAEGIACQTKWKYLALPDTLRGVIEYDVPAHVVCGVVSTASVSFVKTAQGDTMRILQLCNTDRELMRGTRVEVIPETVPSFRVDLIPYDSRACELKEAHFGRIIAIPFDQPDPGKQTTTDAQANEIKDELFKKSMQIVNLTGPWDKPLRAFPGKGVARITFFVSDGLYFGEGPFDVLFNDPLANPALVSTTRLMQYLTEKSLQHGKHSH